MNLHLRLRAGSIAQPSRYWRTTACSARRGCCGKFLEGFTEREQFALGTLDFGIDPCQVDSLRISAHSLTTFTTSLIDQDSAHHFCSRAKEMSPAVPVLLSVYIDQSQIRPVYQRCGQQCLARFFVNQLSQCSRPTATVVRTQRNPLFRSVREFE